MSKTLLCHVSTPAALKCASVMNLQNHRMYYYFVGVFFLLTAWVHL